MVCLRSLDDPSIFPHQGFGNKKNAFMMNKMTKNFLLMLFLSLFTWINSFAQQPQMADQFRKEGKIYVVIGVILIIFAGLVA
ncbi:MAG: CcmD family protein, partial [Bacteroidia bacterium]